MKNSARQMAFGGMMAALAVAIMCMGTLIPGATYVCPMICMVILRLVHMGCGSRVAWAWYGAVTILSLLMAPDKEAGLVFFALGYYPIVKPWMDGRRFPLLWKLALFQAAILSVYGLLVRLMGMDGVLQELQELGTVLTATMLLVGNVTFLLLDRILSTKLRRQK